MNDDVLRELQAIRRAVEAWTQSEPAQRWGDIATVTRLYGLSSSTLRRCINDPAYPPPYRKVRGKLLFDLHAMDEWLRGFPSAKGQQHELVDQILREILDART